MALLLRKRLILIETESTYGTDPTPDGADAVLVRDLSITPQSSDVVSRDLIRPYLGASQQLLANTRVECTFSVELVGSGTAGTAPQYGKALKACGLAETVVANTSVTYDPVSASFSSVTIHYMIDGVRHKMTGCRGNVALTANVGEIPTLDFTFTGIYNAPDDTALSGTFTVANQAAALEVNDTNMTTSTFFGETSQRIESFDLALNNELIYKETASSKEVLITNRAVGGTAVIEAPAVGTTDYFADAVGASTASSSLVLGATGGNIVTLTAAQTDVTGVSYGDTNGVISLSMPYLALPSTSGNDELSLAFT